MEQEYEDEEANIQLAIRSSVCNKVKQKINYQLRL